MPKHLCRWTLALLIGSVGCRAVGSERQATSAPTTSASTAPPVPFSSAKYGFSVQSPAEWTQIKGAADEPLSLVPHGQAAAKDSSQAPSLKMQVPDLPPHIPGLIPVGSVASGYVSDMQKQHPDLKVDERVSVPMANASARRIVSTFQQGQTTWRDMVLCIVHKDRVFLLVADCPAENYPATKAAFDAMASSLKWTEK